MRVCVKRREFMTLIGGVAAWISLRTRNSATVHT
jgi:hypothetical protein